MDEKPSTRKDDPLTAREQEVLTLIAAGRSNKAIADELVLSLNSVKWYVRQIFNKLGVNRRAQAVAEARNLGILAWSDEQELGGTTDLLSERETEVLALMDAGFSNKEIAEKQGISYHTAAWYAKELYRKLGTKRRTQAVAVARSQGLFDGLGVSDQPKHNLPTLSPVFIGREAELAEIETKLMDDACRLLTLLGPGGSGKTRLGIEAANRLVQNFKHGAYFVNLAPVQDADNIPSAIASALKFSFSGERTPENQLLDYLASRHLLLLLDNFELLLAGAAFVNQIIHAAPGLKIMVTSRASLRLTDEHIYPVMGMAYPDMLGVVETVSEQYSAVRLFESGARRRQPHFKLTTDNIFDVARICQMVEGMPLGVILAANWVSVLPTGEIVKELARDLDLLETDLQDLPPRQRSMRSVFNYSWRLLSEKERHLMAALSVFRGDFSRVGAQKVAGASLVDLKNLIDQSMLHISVNGRYEIHELVRQFAMERLGSDPVKAQEIHMKHCDYYCQALAGWERDFNSTRKGEALDEIEIEIDNIRTAWKWAVDKLHLESLSNGIHGLCGFYARRHRYNEGEAACRTLVEKLGFENAQEQSWMENEIDKNRNLTDLLNLLAMALAWQGGFNVLAGNEALGGQLAQNSLSVLERPEMADQDVRVIRGIVLYTMSWVLSGEEAIQSAQESLRCFKTLGEHEWMSIMLNLLGHLTLSNLAESKTYFQESLAIRRKLGDMGGMSHTLDPLSLITARQGHFEKAEAMVIENLAITEELDDRLGIISRFGTLERILIWQGKFSEARALEQEILAAHQDLVNIQNPYVLTLADVGLPDLYLGDYETARNQAQFAIDLFHDRLQIMSEYGTAVATSTLGCVFLAERLYIEADDLFKECLPILRASGRNFGRISACQGYVARGLNKISLAEASFLEFLSKSIIDEDYALLIHTLPGLALLYADQGEIERAVELYALASTQGIVANSKWFADIAGDEIAKMAEELPKDVQEQATERGRALDLWDTAAIVMGEFS
jgi:predicted ATPase/DNA-binding NarL/FixJ family response regulator